MNIARNPNLRASELKARFQEDGIVQIRDFLTKDSARFAEQALRALPWELAFREGNQVTRLTSQELQRMTPQRAAEIRQRVDQGARSGFQFMYNVFPMLQAYTAPGAPDQQIFRLFEFLNGEENLAFLKDVTGLEDARWLDAQGALYQAGHFLTYHTDASNDEPRLAAYVLSFAHDWKVDWGGLLQFWNDDDDISLALRPRFNALNIFTVPRRHSVSAVTQWSPGLRFSVTGWMRADEPPPLSRA